MRKVYFISGLGADRRAFDRIRITNVEKVFVDWIEPDRRDTIATYAGKLISHYGIKHNDTVVGLSLGGVMAIEINKQIGLAKAILISSIRSTDEAPAYFKTFSRWPVFKLASEKAIIDIAARMVPVMGKMEKVKTNLFTDMIRDSSPKFVKWAMGAILKWQSTTQFDNVYQIIGDKDRVFDFRKTPNATVIKGGSHIMVYNRADEVSAWLEQILAE
ncbi:alpha/beta hydrolase [Mucilaginibacter ginkgonis]|uniref:Alpha/beta hydrolase n=1 Tax=Mucilaginibacter ginkgonis TaxID=2682091 RepID=A0A6I4HWW4_9SPHI|nr:alpha/beta hydrolase [Mucilaginibacter ginkgonis]QQL51427.1 alpha/beta hydrolase [Mucilaginibacter ginkgonis]